jgi:hypothetical protein
MQKLVIANKGRSYHGKTQALKKVIEDLLSNGAKEVKRKTYSIDEDETAILDYKGIRIGIETQGDPKSRLFPSLKDFVQENCEIIVCACRTSGNTYEAVVNLKKTTRL